MSEDTNVTEWSLPGQMDVPRDELKIQMEVYVETILLRIHRRDVARPV